MEVFPATNRAVRWFEFLFVLLPLIAFSTWAFAQVPACTTSAPVASSVPSTASTQRVYAFGVQNTTSVQFSTWWVPGNQADIKSLQGTNAGNGTWYVDVPLAQFDNGTPPYGNFETDVYLSNSTNANILCGSSTWTRNGAAQGSTGGQTYLYDANSRLTYLNTVATTDNYGYDPLGNILSITQSSPPAITSISPAQGVVGTQVTIHGGPFPSGASTVSFNGPVVPTTTVDANDLVAIVPAGSNTGFVAVTFSDGTIATSPTIFTVLTGSPDNQGAQPTISAVSLAGSTVTVTGTNFNPVPGQTVVSLGGTQGAITTISDIQIKFTLPARQGSGYIHVTTPYGTAVSATPLMINLSGSYPIVSLTMGNPTAVSLTLSGNSPCGAYTFSGQAGSWVSLQLSSLMTSGSVSWILYGPNNQPVTNLDNTTFNQLSPTICGQPANNAVTGSVASSNMSVHLPPLPSTGYYTLVFAGTSTLDSMSATVSVDPVVAQGGTITTNIGGAYQSQRVQFAGTTGQLIVEDATTLSITPSGNVFTQTWITTLGLPTGSASNGAGMNQTLSLVASATSAYRGTLISSPGGATGTVQISLSTSIAGTVVIDGSTLSINQTNPGRATLVGVSLSAGQAVTLALTNISTTATTLSADLYDPVGNEVHDFLCAVAKGVGNCSWDLAGWYSLPLPTITGTYTLVLTPNLAATYSANITVSSDLTTTIAANTFTSVNLPRHGQTEALSFTNTTGMPVLFNILDNSASPSNERIWGWATYTDTNGSLELLQSGGAASTAGTLLWFDMLQGESISLHLAADSSTGTVIEGTGTGGTGSANVYADQSIYQATLNPAGTSNPSYSFISATHAGQAKQLEFSNPSNSSVSVQVTNPSTSDGQGGVEVIAFYSVSNGTQWYQNYVDLGSCAVSAGTCTYTLPSSGFGGGPVMLVIFPDGPIKGPDNYGQDYEGLPHSRAVTFHAKVTLIAQ